MPRLTVIGTVVREDIETTTQSSPPPPVLGGSGVYAAAAAQLLCGVDLVGDVGTDFPPNHLHCLQSMNIDLAGIRNRDGTTFYWKARYSRDMRTRKTLALSLGVYEKYYPQLNQKCRENEYAIIANLSPDSQKMALEQLESPRVSLLGTIDHWVRNERPSLVNLLPKVTGFIANCEEVTLLAEDSNPIAAAKHVLTLGPRFVVVTMAEQGAMLLIDDIVIQVPAFPCTNVVDPTGAGDSFAGGLLANMVRESVVDFGERTLHRAMLYGTAVASLCVEAFSVEGLRQTKLEEVERRVKHLAGLGDFRC